MSEDTHKTIPYSRRDAQDKEITFKFAADATAEHPYASTGHGRGAYVSDVCAPGRTSQAPLWPGWMGWGHLWMIQSRLFNDYVSYIRYTSVT